MDLRKFEVKVILSAEEFVACKSIAEAKGLSQSSFIRMHVKEVIARHCAEQATNGIDRESAGNWTDNIRPFDMRIANR